MIFDYLAGYYQPENAVLAIAGDIPHQELIDTAVKATGTWKGKRTGADYLPFREKAARRVKIEKRDTEQTHLMMALPGISIYHPDRFKLNLLNVVLGEGMSSRLFTEIRDNLGLAYSIHSFNEHLQDTGAITVSAGVDTGKLKIAIQAIVNELERLKEPVPEKELIKAKEFSKGRLLLRLEDSRSVSGWLGGQEILTGEMFTVDQVISIIDAITVEELQEIANELFAADRIRLAVVGPVDPDESLEDLLKP
jgi:predicted Zn-dependent peptidase